MIGEEIKSQKQNRKTFLQGWMFCSHCHIKTDKLNDDLQIKAIHYQKKNQYSTNIIYPAFLIGWIYTVLISTSRQKER